MKLLSPEEREIAQHYLDVLSFHVKKGIGISESMFDFCIENLQDLLLDKKENKKR